MLTKLIFFTGVGVVGDYVLNAVSLLSPGNKELAALRPYWKSYGAGMGALAAGLTTLTAGILTLLLSKMLSVSDLPSVILIAFALGVFGDVLINITNFFGPPLEDWYKTVGTVKSALYGGLAIALAVGIGVLVENWFRKRS